MCVTAITLKRRGAEREREREREREVEKEPGSK